MMAILLGGLGISFLLVRDEETKISRTSALLEFSIFLKDSVENYSMSASEILRSCDERLLERCGYETGAELPKTFLDFVSKIDVPDSESRRAVDSLVRDFGSCYRREQVDKCERCISALRKREDSMVRAFPIRKKVIISVCVCASLVLLILLL